ncbi:MAG: tRNA 2-thiouridine(34) synthase MnmA [Brevinemataceae bacterium]
MKHEHTPKHVFIGMSGGIDSSAAAQLLVDQGFQVTGVTFVGLGKDAPKSFGKQILSQKSSRKCCSSEEVLIAKDICYNLGISHITLDLTEIFAQEVKQPFIQSYLKGETPNPCILCNRFVKMGALIEFALKNGADYVAMGHYTGIECVNGEYLLKSGKDLRKDQSYFLSFLKPEYLQYLMFPLADKEKSEIRAIIDNSDLPISSSKSESQDVCFIDNDYREYLKEHGVQNYPGDMILDNNIIGQHKGAAFYALGQRRGLETSIGKKVFVRKIDADNNKIYLGEKPKSNMFKVSDLNIFSKSFTEGTWLVQTRYRSARIPADITFINQDTIQVMLSEPQEIVTPGQYAVFYRNDFIYAAGKIIETELL